MPQLRSCSSHSRRPGRPMACTLLSSLGPLPDFKSQVVLYWKGYSVSMIDVGQPQPWPDGHAPHGLGWASPSGRDRISKYRPGSKMGWGFRLSHQKNILEWPWETGIAGTTRHIGKQRSLRVALLMKPCWPGLSFVSCGFLWLQEQCCSWVWHQLI